MIRIRGIKVEPGTTPQELRRLTAEMLGVSRDKLTSFTIVRRSVDARRKNEIRVEYTVEAEAGAAAEQRLLKKNSQASAVTREEIPGPVFGKEPLRGRPLVIGMGPAGLFAALELAKYGYRPIVWERGAPVEERTGIVRSFQQGGPFSPLSNIQFGEGGAGTFSDGKLTNRGKDPLARTVLETLVKAGAPEDILYQHRGHVGTDLLREILPRIRKEIIRLGGEVSFHTRLEQLKIENGEVRGAVSDRAGLTETGAVILAIGHSARDTLRGLSGSGLFMEAKSSAMGVRIEHLQHWLDKLQYGKFAGNPDLGPADYQISTHIGERSVYSFCMCPGGFVVNASSEEGRLCVNGMSHHARSGVNCNAALVCQTDPADYGNDGPLAGLAFQEALEAKAFAAGGGDWKAPAMRVEDFLRGRRPTTFGDVKPTVRPGAVPADLREVLPGFIADTLARAIPTLDGHLHGFAFADAVMTGVETRTSSPVRIPRGADGCAISLAGLYPAGEGAGYAGGIVSSAVDGIREARALMARFAAPGETE